MLAGTLLLHALLLAAFRLLRASRARRGLPGPSLPPLLVFPFPELFVTLLFLMPLAASGGRLLSTGISHSRALPLAIGVLVLLLVLAVVWAVLRLVVVLWRRYDQLDLQYLPYAPPPASHNEGTFVRWLRTSEVGSTHDIAFPCLAPANSTRNAGHACLM